mmetsp:Transcript_52205/g.132611  ORF Transcript_52205/g.132611 Transcript_52205/m.132611 type:complete len:222 (+) Transcript_52205:534-1199(+)
MPLGHNLLQSSLCSIVHPMLTTEVNDRFALRCIKISSAPAEKLALVDLSDLHTAQAWRRSRKSQNQTQLLDIAVNLSGILAQGSREPVFDAVVQIIFVAEGVDVGHLFRRESTHRRILHRRIPLLVREFVGRLAPVCIGRATASLQPKGAIVELSNFHTAQARRISCSSQNHVHLHDVAVNLSGMPAQGSNEPVFDMAFQIILGAEGGDFGGLLRREGAQN